MTVPSLEELEAQRARLYERLATSGDFRRGSVSENYRGCGKPGCHCAWPGDPGHGPRYLWTRTVPGGRGSTGRQLSPGEVEKGARRAGQLPAVRRGGGADRGGQRGHLRGPPAERGRSGASGRDGGRKRGLYDQFQAEIAAELGRLATKAARTLNTSGQGLEVAEMAIRAAMLHLGADLLEKLLDADTGHRGQRLACGNGHYAEFVSYRIKRVDTVLGRIRLRRAY